MNPIAIGTLFLISRIVDAINDPIMGFVMNACPERKSGKFRSLLMVGGVIATINFAYDVVWSSLGTVGKLTMLMSVICF